VVQTEYRNRGVDRYATSGDFTAGECCNGWSDMTNASTARWAISTATDGSAFSTNGMVGCAVYQFWIYCVEQPRRRQ